MWVIVCPPYVLGSEIGAEHLTDQSQDAQGSSEAILPPFESRIDNVLPNATQVRYWAMQYKCVLPVRKISLPTMAADASISSSSLLVATTSNDVP